MSLKQTFVIIITFLMLASCKDETHLDFKESSIESTEGAEIAINIPKASGTETVANNINSTLDNHIIAQSNFTDSDTSNKSVDQAIAQFNKEFTEFQSNFPESSQTWEYFVDGEITYNSEQLICIALTTYLDTGGAHGNTNVKFFNFDPETGLLIPDSEFILDLSNFKAIVKEALVKTLKTDGDNSVLSNLFFGEEFQLPESLGFSDEGIIIIYNPYEIAAYSQGIIEFTIPYESLESSIEVY